MTTLLVTRHAGAREWAEEAGMPVDTVLDHLEPEQVAPGDVVIGSLPVHLAAEVCSRGGRYLHLVLQVPAEARGAELSAEQMRAFGARVVAYRVVREEV